MNRRTEFPLAARITLAVMAVIVVTALALGFFGRKLILDQFAETEQDLVRQNRSILDRVIATEVEHLQAIATDWGQWDDLHDYVLGRNPDFEASELGNVVLDRLELDAILVILPDGSLRYGEVRPDPEFVPAPGAADPAEALTRLLAGTAVPGDVSHPGRATLLPDPLSRTTIAGLMDTARGPMVLSIRPVSRTDGSGEAAGLLVMGRYLDAGKLFAAVSVLPSKVIPHGSGRERMSVAMHDLARQLVTTASDSRLVTRTDDMSDFKIFPDLAGKPAFLLETRMPRTIVATGRDTAEVLMTGVLVTAAVTLLMLVALIRGVVSAPLRSLAGHMLALRDGGGSGATPGVGRNDEIGALARHFDGLVAAQRQAQQRLEILAAAVEHAGDAIAILDAEGRVRYVNPAYERSRGVRGADLVGHSPGEVFRSQDEMALSAMWATVSAGSTWSGRITTGLPGGRQVTEEVVVSPVTSAGAAPSSYVVILHDVTERIRLEQQLSQAQRLEAMGRLAAGVAHEINTPTQYVGGNIRFLREAFASLSALLADVGRLVRGAPGGSVPTTELARVLAAADSDYLQAEVPAAIRQSLEGVERVGEIVRSMRELTHPARDFAPTDLNRIVESAVRVAGGEWQSIAELRAELDPALPPVPCQAGGINQVVVNMLVNAAHAIEARGPGERGLIVVSTRSDGEVAEIRVSDNGCGMSEAVRGRVFDLFFTTKEVGQGTGQGLAIAHSVVKKHDGTIVVESWPGRGTCFTIRLPLARPAAAETAAA